MILRGSLDIDDGSILRELGKQRSKDTTLRVNCIVDRLIFHQFGNYVLQKIINVVRDNELRSFVLRRLNQLSGELSKTKHGFKVLQKLQKTYPEHFQNNNQSQTNQGGFFSIKGGDCGEPKTQRKYSLIQGNSGSSQGAYAQQRGGSFYLGGGSNYQGMRY